MVERWCGFCATAPGKALWIRVRAAGARAYACSACDARLLWSKEDEGPTPLDYSRMSELYVRIGGEVWERGGTDYWFREPVHVVTATHAGASVRPSASPLRKRGLLDRFRGRPPRDTPHGHPRRA